MREKFPQPKCSPRRIRGRLAKTTSLLVKHSSTADGEDKRRTRRVPRLRRRIGPCLDESWERVRWRGLFLKMR
ncbi:hypothetical protein WN944_002869 [Citrus x changshan-huyou]|uniref:Uncharacterized protein n=1 Tax=Citrus x changshan-huyou TaxID=2935761 RepID=A0AAP0MM46_9ROSI